MQLTVHALSLLAVLAPALAAPSPVCNPPKVAIRDLANQFTLSVVGLTQAFSPVRLNPFNPTAKTSSVPVFSTQVGIDAFFTLQNGTLVSGGFPAHRQPSIKIFPPPLQGFEFGGDQGLPAQAEPFFAQYACENGEQILQLRPVDGMLEGSGLVRKIFADEG